MEEEGKQILSKRIAYLELWAQLFKTNNVVT